jgi:hypothetical protein
MSRRWLLLLLVPLAACSSSSKASPPAASVTTPPTDRTTTTLTVEQQVEAAYLKSWDVYAKAVRTLDASGLEVSYVGDALTLETQEVADLKAANTPIVVQVKHSIGVQVVKVDEAIVFDRYENRNYRTDASGKAIDDPNKVGIYSDSYQMKRIGGSWFVARIVRQSSAHS